MKVIEKRNFILATARLMGYQWAIDGHWLIVKEPDGFNFTNWVDPSERHGWGPDVICKIVRLRIMHNEGLDLGKVYDQNRVHSSNGETVGL